ncbi:MAG: Peptidyl-prolyl cis-trans isomerase [uncultured Acidimicrobiales bacterium]|uniref:Peptidyl-prolyl cis-trans isomerase n=1 Tax=uncultured Acidimicrobiales bacterium TaxID=310071 RepID=A0A6J4IVG0_9ACTN|nr:MAG: Peptidyl-prolyl cis-trans isomerase [uncultured Acidimicrobiales bacterium]
MASTKRQRKKENQAARRAALEAARRRQKRKRQTLNVAGLLVGVLLLGVALVFIAGRGEDDSAAPPTTSTGPGVTLASLPPVPPGRAIKGDTPCPKPTGEERASSFEKAPPMCIDPAKGYRAVFTTSAGVVKVDLDTKRTPLTANNFVVLARYRYYDGSSFPRTDPSIDIIQGGSPGTQSISDPGPGYNIKDEGGQFSYTEGDLVMARSEGPDSASAQFFFAAGPATAQLNSQGTYVTFGKVVEGLDVLKKVLASHVDCPDPEAGGACLGGAPQPPVKVDALTIEET